ncbi:MAG: hypothetical protein WDN67_03900 [Candidatus Moraniibacteriota bacterium]
MPLIYWHEVLAEFLGGLGTAVVLGLFAYITRRHIFFKVVRRTAKHLREEGVSEEK